MISIIIKLILILLFLNIYIYQTQVVYNFYYLYKEPLNVLSATHLGKSI